MEHLINWPIEAYEMQETVHHCGDSVKLCFFYHRGLAVGYDVVLATYGADIIGEVISCAKLEDNLFKVEVGFVSEAEAFKIRMLEQAVRIERYQEDNPEMTLEEAANAWVIQNGALFPSK